MKLGQVMSFLDVGLVEEQYREEFQAELAKLRDAAPTVAFKQMRKVIEDDLGERVAAVFEDFEEEPLAAASIGQVYRARLREDGREVAVKVQYPGVAAAVRADLQNLDMIMRLLKRMTPQLDVRAVAKEIKERIGEELDYELEASEPALAGAHLPRAPVHQDPRGGHRALARARDGERARGGGRLRGAEGLPAGTSATASGRSCSASSSAASTATASSPATRTPATSCCWRTGGWRSWTSASSSASTRRRWSWSSPRSARSSSTTREALHTLLARVGLPAAARAGGPRGAAGVPRGRDRVVHDRRGRRADPGGRDRGDDRELRPALAATSATCATRTCAPSTCSAGAWRC